VSTEVLEDAMSDTTSDTHCDQDTAQISEEYLAQLKELADSQGWSLDGTLRRALAVTKAGLRGQDGKVYVYRRWQAVLSLLALTPVIGKPVLPEGPPIARPPTPRGGMGERLRQRS
jgi:hypothetical protein